MGYDLTWADDDREEARNRVMDAVVDALQGEDMNVVSNTMFRSLEAVGGYFRSSQSMMRSLIAEMDEQGMFVENESMREKLERQEGTITPEEIETALDHVNTWPPSPRHPQPEVVVSEFDQMMEKAALERDIISEGGAKAMMQLHPLAWAQKWIDWLVFIDEAAEHRGINVA